MIEPVRIAINPVLDRLEQRNSTPARGMRRIERSDRRPDGRRKLQNLEIVDIAENRSGKMRTPRKQVG